MNSTEPESLALWGRNGNDIIDEKDIPLAELEALVCAGADFGLIGDINGDGEVDSTDLNLIFSNFSNTYP